MSLPRMQYPAPLPGPWRLVVGHPDYEIDQECHIRRRDRPHRILRPSHNYVVLNGRRCHTPKLALRTYFPTVLPAETVDHLDENYHNNALSNLHWCTRRENAAKSCRFRAGRPREAREVQMVDRGTGAVVQRWRSRCDAARALSISLSGRLSAAGTTVPGFVLRYKPDPDLPGERWYGVPDDVRVRAILCRWLPHTKDPARLRVSHLGRIDRARGTKTWGNLPTRGRSYRRFSGVLVHNLIMLLVGHAERPPHFAQWLADLDLPWSKRTYAILHDDTVPRDADGCTSNAWVHLRLGTQSENLLEYHTVRRARKRRRLDEGEPTASPVVV